jgi:hypothetical protein
VCGESFPKIAGSVKKNTKMMETFICRQHLVFHFVCLYLFFEVSIVFYRSFSCQTCDDTFWNYWSIFVRDILFQLERGWQLSSLKWNLN